MGTGITELDEWLADRPESVQRLAIEFPLQTPVLTADGPGFVIGWTEGDELLVSPVHPLDDWDASLAARRRVPADAFRR